MRAAPRRRGSVAWQVAVAVLLVWLSFGPFAPLTPVGAAREIDVVGTVDCGRPSGRYCDVSDTLALWTDGPAGRVRLVVDVRWVARSLPSLDQDDALCLLVEEAPGGQLRAVGLVEPCGHEGTVNPGASTGSREVREQRRPREEDDEARQAAVGTVTLTGTVVSATTSQPIAGARVAGLGGMAATTNAAGQFTLRGVPAGSQVLQASAAGFATATRSISVAEGTSPPLAFALAPLTSATQDEIVLSWGEPPADLDIHLSGPAGGGRFHLYFGNPDPVPHASLISDQRSGPGGELIVIRRDPATNQFVPGEYRVWVHNFSGSPDFPATGAALAVVSDGVQVGRFEVTAASGDPSQDLWHVVNLTIDANGSVTLRPVQQFKPGHETTVL